MMGSNYNNTVISSLLLILLTLTINNNSQHGSNSKVDAFSTMFQTKTHHPWGKVTTATTTTPTNSNSIHSFSRTCRLKTLLLKDKWDDLVDEDEEDFGPQGPDVPKDMRYIEFNLMRQNNHFVAIRQAGGPTMTNDLYARDPDTDVFWFCGKVARISDVSTAQAVGRQFSLIEEHACRLRPLELFPKRGSIELWVAPGDSEMDVAYNRPSIQLEKMKTSSEVDGADSVKNILIGFQGEVYDTGEEGFRTCRTEDGLPSRPEVKGPEEETPEIKEPQKGEKRPPTDEEMIEISEILKGQDLNDLFDKE